MSYPVCVCVHATIIIKEVMNLRERESGEDMGDIGGRRGTGKMI